MTYQLIDGYGKDAAVKALVDKFDFYILPFVNPDGMSPSLPRSLSTYKLIVRPRLRLLADRRPPLAQDPPAAQRHQLRRHRREPQLAVPVGRARRREHEPVFRDVQGRGRGRHAREPRARGLHAAAGRQAAGHPAVRRLALVRAVHPAAVRVRLRGARGQPRCAARAGGGHGGRGRRALRHALHVRAELLDAVHDDGRQRRLPDGRGGGRVRLDDRAAAYRGRLGRVRAAAGADPAECAGAVGRNEVFTGSDLTLYFSRTRQELYGCT